MAEIEEEDEKEQENGKQPELKTRKDVLDYARQKYEYEDVVEEVGREVTSENFNEKLKLIRFKVQQLKHWADEYWNRVHEARENKLREIAKFDKYNVALFAVAKEYDRMEYEAWKNYSAIEAFEVVYLWEMFAIFYNSYAKEHETVKSLDDDAKEMLKKSIATTLAFAKEYGVLPDTLDLMVKENMDKLNENRRAAFEQENARVKEIQDANLKYTRAHKDKRGEVKWNELWEKVGAHFTRSEWESATKKQETLRIRRERHGSKRYRFVSEIPGVVGENSDVGSGERH